MSATKKSTLVLRSASLDELETPCLVLPFLATEKPLRGLAGMADWRLNGKISEQLLRARITGKKDETVLIPSAHRLRAQNLLLVGLGEAHEVDAQSYQAALARVSTVLTKAKVPGFVYSFHGEIDPNEQILWFGEFLVRVPAAFPWEVLVPAETVLQCETLVKERFGKRVECRVA